MVRAVAVAVALVMFAACSGDSDSGQEVEVVAGGQDGGRITGFVFDIDVQDDRVAMVGEVGQKAPTLWRVDRPGSVEQVPLVDMAFPTGVAVAPNGAVFVLDSSGIWKVQGTRTELYVGDRDAERASTQTESGDIQAVAVDESGRLLWTQIAEDERRGSDRLLIVVRRLEDGQVTTIAGTERSTTAPDAVLYAQQESPPAGSRAVEFPMLVPGAAYDLAADSTGVYLLGGGYVLRITPDGTLTKVLGGEGRDVPERPFADEGSALNHGFVVRESGISVDDGRIVVLDGAMSAASAVSTTDQDGDFDWLGDFSEDQQALVDRVMSVSAGYASGPPYRLGGLALLVEDGEATTAAAHVQAAAVDGDWLYVVGQAGRFEDPGPEAAILVRLSLENRP